MSAAPIRIRTSGLQEQQVGDVVKLEESLATTQRGFQPRSLTQVVGLTKLHNVRVAESDDVVLGWVAWRDESPGVGIVEHLAVHPRFQRFGVGHALVEVVRGEARGVPLEHLVVRVSEGANAASPFLKKEGFVPLDDKADQRVLDWRDEQTAKGPLVEAGHRVLWGRVDPAGSLLP
jgi:N-acetylglutamate synthase-like GNAT family acetyltransferase